MKHIWLYLNRDDLDTEKQQCEEEGKDISTLVDKFEEEAVERLHQRWDENRSHDWCHTISNAMVVTLGLLWGELNYQDSICRAVQACYDTDCNAATVGSIVGMILGASHLPKKWTDPIHDTLQTGVAGYHKVRVSELARETLEVIERVLP